MTRLARLATVHVVERDCEGISHLWEVDVKITPDQDEGLKIKDKLSYKEVIRRVRYLVDLEVKRNCNE